MTQKEIAVRLGISTAAVSNILRGKGRFSESTKAQVFDAMRDSGFRPKFVLRPVIFLHEKASEENTQGLINVFKSFNGIRTALSGEDMETRIDLVPSLTENPGKFMEMTLQLIDRHNPVGIILNSSMPGCRDVASMISERNIKVIIFGYEIEIPEFSSVMADSFNGAYDAVRHLILKGHSRIGIIRWNPAGTPNSQKKFSAYKCALAEYGIPFKPDYVVESALSNARLAPLQRPGREAFDRLMKCSGRRPTAVFVENSYVSHSLIYPLKDDKGILPAMLRDTEFIHFEDTTLLASSQIMNGALNYGEHPVQCCHMDWEKMGVIAGDLMARMAKSGSDSVHSLRVKPELKYMQHGRMNPMTVLSGEELKPRAAGKTA